MLRSMGGMNPLMQMSKPPTQPQNYVMEDHMSTMSSASMSTPKLPTFNTLSVGDMTKVLLSPTKDPLGKGKTTGILKFFNEGKGFGFFVSDADGKDVFFHYEDVKDLKLSKDFLREAKNKFIVKFAFTVQIYYGKYNYSTKAVDIELLGMIDQRLLSASDN